MPAFYPEWRRSTVPDTHQSFRYEGTYASTTGWPAATGENHVIRFLLATGRSLAGGYAMSEVLLSAQRNHLHEPWLPSILLRWPGIYQQDVKSHKNCKLAWRR
ncbi:hypothetical protein LPN04_12085 [Rugamonas sp. A1-17]|nr:hypothetical protein [Rugamonas sp. A1-17]